MFESLTAFRQQGLCSSFVQVQPPLAADGVYTSTLPIGIDPDFQPRSSNLIPLQFVKFELFLVFSQIFFRFWLIVQDFLYPVDNLVG